jgi:hypothetical protein
LTKLQAEKTTIENEMNETINTLKQEFEKFLNERGKFLVLMYQNFNFCFRTSRKEETS